VAAFTEARRLGADGVELDVRRSADGAVVVHDAAVAACGDLLVNIELKDLPGEPGWDPSYPLAAMVAAFVVSHDLAERVVVSSFELAAVDALRWFEPDVPTAWLTPGGFDQVAALESVLAAGHRALHPHHTAVTPELVGAAHTRGIGVVTWTVDEPGRIAEMAAARVDGIITNRPEEARRVLDGL